MGLVEMAKGIVLVSNLGHCGGFWFMELCNLHNRIAMWIEMNYHINIEYSPEKIGWSNYYLHYPNLRYKTRLTYFNPKTHVDNFDIDIQCEITKQVLIDLYKNRNEEVIGYIKSFNKNTIEACKNICDDVTIVQMIRHPVFVVDYYTKQKYYQRHGIIPGDDKGLFRVIVRRFSSKLERYIIRRKDHNQEIIKLEDINKSMKKDGLYVKNLLERIFKKKWSESLIARGKTLSYGRKDIRHEDFTKEEIWGNWQSWQKKLFLEYFENYLKDLNYDKFL